MRNDPLAVIWDYDGTIVSSFKRNQQITCQIFDHLGFSKTHELTDFSTYRQLLDRVEGPKELLLNLGLIEDQIGDVTSRWDQFQANHDQQALIYDGLAEVIKKVQVPQAIVSHNTVGNIRRTLEQNNVLAYFSHIVGYETFKESKPNPKGLVACIDRLTAEEGLVVFIGDHWVDMKTAYNANLQGKSVFTIGVSYNRETEWKYKPNRIIHTPQEIPSVLEMVANTSFTVNGDGMLV